MPAYIVATVTIHDVERFGLYAKGIAGLSERFGGETIVKGQVSAVPEGQSAPGERVIVSRYPDEAAARAYLDSPEYRAAAEHRKGAADVTIRLLVD